MAIGLGELLGGAGRGLSAFRQGQAETRQAELDKYRLEEQRRLQALKQQEQAMAASMQPDRSLAESYQAGLGAAPKMGIATGAPAAAPAAAPATPAAPAAPAAPTPTGLEGFTGMPMQTPQGTYIPPAWLPPEQAAAPVAPAEQPTGTYRDLETYRRGQAAYEKFGPIIDKIEEKYGSNAAQTWAARIGRELATTGGILSGMVADLSGIAKRGAAVAAPDKLKVVTDYFGGILSPEEITEAAGKTTIPRAGITVPTPPPPAWQPGDKLEGKKDYQKAADYYAQQAGVDPELFRRLIQAESSWNPGAKSKKDAFGLTQVVPKTAAQPGFNVQPMADQSIEEQLRFGADYLAAMINEFGGDTRLALAAYNAGPNRVKELQGVPPIKETRDYVNKILKGYEPGAPTEAAPTEEAPQVTPTGRPSVNEDVEYYLADPQSVPYELQLLREQTNAALNNALRRRNEQARMAQMYMASGTDLGRQLAAQYQAQVDQLDAQIDQAQMEVRQKEVYLQGMQGIYEFAQMNDPRRLASVVSLYSGQDINYQPRTDGLYNILIDGKLARSGVSGQEISSNALKKFDDASRQSAAELAKLEAEEAIKAKYGPEQYTALSQLWQEIIKGENKLKEIREERKGYQITDLGNDIVLAQKDGALFRLDAGGIREMPIGGTVVQLPNIPQQIQFPLGAQ